MAIETERAWQALGAVSYDHTDAERESLVFRRSIYASADIAAGEPFTRQNIRIVRPGYGAPPSIYEFLIGRVVGMSIKMGTPISLENLF